MDFVKYPKTQALDRIFSQNASLDSLLSAGQALLIEEKMDGTQLGLQFDQQAQPILQSRGTIISNETEFAWMKAWVWEHYTALYERLGQRYIVFGEWLWATAMAMFTAKGTSSTVAPMFDITRVKNVAKPAMTVCKTQFGTSPTRVRIS